MDTHKEYGHPSKMHKTVNQIGAWLYLNYACDDGLEGTLI
jgi:hypothetical protein